MDQALERIEVPAGTVVKMGGVPFELAADTVVRGIQGNYRLAKSQSDTSLGNPNQAARIRSSRTASGVALLLMNQWDSSALHQVWLPSSLMRAINGP